MSQPLIRLQHVSRFYRTVIGVGDLNLELAPGAHGLIGPNGSGKTTFINLLTGVLVPSLGRVEVFGQQPARSRDVLRQIGLCPASDILYPHITGLQWVEYLTALHGFSRQEALQRSIDSLVRVGMEKDMRRPIGSYSLGMRQRVKLAQAIAHGPQLLILDEPFNGLDPIGRHELTEFLRLWSDSGRSLILASHILHEVEAITSSFLLIHGGRILASGNASEVRSMLSGFPVEVEISGDGLEHIAKSFSDEPWLTGLEFSEDRSRLVLRVRDQGRFQQQLAELACSPGIMISSIDSPDGTLEAAFELLLRVHRGEHTPGTP